MVMKRLCDMCGEDVERVVSYQRLDKGLLVTITGSSERVGPSGVTETNHVWDVCLDCMGEITRELCARRENKKEAVTELGKDSERLQDGHDLETRCDPSGDLQTIASQRDQISELLAQVAALKDARAQNMRKCDKCGESAEWRSLPDGLWCRCDKHVGRDG